MYNPNLVHVYPIRDSHKHNLTGGANCYCEPHVVSYGDDKRGRPIRIFIHQKLVKRISCSKKQTNNKERSK